jgi:hypothetical protein
LDDVVVGTGRGHQKAYSSPRLLMCAFEFLN